jgi:hypothetical protein
MSKVLNIQGRELSEEDVEFVRSLLRAHPQWSRRKLSIALAEGWAWRSANGQLKDMAARSLLVKLEARGWVRLPPRSGTGGRQTPKRIYPAASAAAIEEPLASLQPLEFEVVRPGTQEATLFRGYLSAHHYLGYSGPVGQNLAYLVRDGHGREVACVLFGAAAWKAAARDAFIGWTPSQRQERLFYLANNSRFLILPWVRVPHLASHVLGRLMRRLGSDWQGKYQQPLYLVESFVERERFRGTCYQAANWIWVGQTQGRSRQDRDRTLAVPIKDIYGVLIEMYVMRGCSWDSFCGNVNVIVKNISITQTKGVPYGWTRNR